MSGPQALPAAAPARWLVPAAFLWAPIAAFICYWIAIKNVVVLYLWIYSIPTALGAVLVGVFTLGAAGRSMSLAFFAFFAGLIAVGLFSEPLFILFNFLVPAQSSTWMG